VLFLFGQLDVDHIAGSGKGYEYDQVVYPGQGFAFSCDISDGHGLKHGQLFLFAGQWTVESGGWNLRMCLEVQKYKIVGFSTIVRPVKKWLYPF
jgi:hypothetical protein